MPAAIIMSPVLLHRLSAVQKHSQELRFSVRALEPRFPQQSLSRTKLEDFHSGTSYKISLSRRKACWLQADGCGGKQSGGKLGRSVISCALSCPVLLAFGFIVHESLVAAEPLELTSPVTSIRKTGMDLF